MSSLVTTVSDICISPVYFNPGSDALHIIVPFPGYTILQVSTKQNHIP